MDTKFESTRAEPRGWILAPLVLIAFTLILGVGACGSEKDRSGPGTGGSPTGGSGGSGGEGGTGGHAGTGGSPGQTVAKVWMSPETGHVRMEETLQFTAKAFDAEDRELPGLPVAWSSEDEEVATVDSNGLVTGILDGVTRIFATIGGVEGSSFLLVDKRAIDRIEVFPDEVTVEVGDTVFLSAEGYDATGELVETMDFDWRAEDSTVLSPGFFDGSFVGLKAGSTTVEATSQGKTGTAVVTVVDPS